MTYVFTLEGRERGGLGPDAAEKVVPRNSIKRVSGEGHVTMCRGRDASTFCLGGRAITEDRPLVLVAVVQGVSTHP